jgi:25S rRNA (cytosine2870-C5)-methyltransferase
MSDSDSDSSVPSNDDFGSESGDEPVTKENLLGSSDEDSEQESASNSDSSDDSDASDDGSSDDELPIERKARQLEAKTKIAAVNEAAEMKVLCVMWKAHVDDASHKLTLFSPGCCTCHQRITQDAEVFQLPSAEELEEEKRMPPDMSVVHKRIQDVVGVLMDFTRRRYGDASRTDYIALLSADIGNYYGYNEELVSLCRRVLWDWW